MKVRRLSLRDKELFNGYLSSAGHELSCFSFANIYIWKGLFDIFWACVEDCLLVFFRDTGGCFLYLPVLGERPSGAVVQQAFSLMDRLNSHQGLSRIENIEHSQVGFYQGLGYDLYQKSGEYLYKRSDLVNLSGGRFKSKRASYNYFVKRGGFTYGNFEPAEGRQCLRLYADWARGRKARNANPLYQGFLDDSHSCLRVLLKDYRRLGISGRVIKQGKRLSAFSFGLPLNRDTFCILFEVADLSLKGAAQFIFREFCRDAGDYRYINVMDDSGLKNLQEVKLSYRPLKQLAAYVARRNHG